jgi:hypothetical protein
VSSDERAELTAGSQPAADEERPGDAAWKRPGAVDDPAGSTVNEVHDPSVEGLSWPAVAELSGPSIEELPGQELDGLAGVPVERTRRLADARATVGARLARLRPAFVVVTFVAGVVLGLVAFGALNPAPAAVPWPALPGIPEPQDAHDVAAALKAGDAATLGNLLDATTLSSLGTEVDQVTDIGDVQFLGAVGDSTESYVAYLVRGHNGQGAKTLQGVVLHSMAGHIIAINR